MKDTIGIARIVRDSLAADFKTLPILDVRVLEDFDDEGAAVLRVEVLLDGMPSDGEIARLVGVVRHVRPKLLAAEELAFPVFSFISNRDVGADHFAAA
jgi:hypothetical protein